MSRGSRCYRHQLAHLPSRRDWPENARTGRQWLVAERDLVECVAECLELFAAQTVDEVPPHLLDVVGSRSLQTRLTGRSEHGEGATSICRAPVPFDHAGGDEPVEAPGQATGRQQEPLGQLTHAHAPVLAFRQLDEDPVVGHGDALARLEVGVQPG